jgi:hypothetical protein
LVSERQAVVLGNGLFLTRPLLRCSPHFEELLLSSLAQTDALSKLLIEKDIITQQEFLAKISEERATYQAMLKPTSH